MSTTTDKFLFRIELNPTLSAGVTFNNVTDYGVQYALGAGETITTAGYIIAVGGGDQNATTDFDVDGAIKLGSTITGTPDEIWITVKPLSSNADIHRGINWREPS